MVRQASLAALVAVVAVLGLGQALGGRYWTPGLGLDGGDPPPTTGQALIDDFQCRFAETRTVQMRGLEDGFSTAGREPSRPPASTVDRLSSVTHLRPIDYDIVQPDSYVADRFELDPGTVSSLFLTSLRTRPDDKTDTLFFGDLDDTRDPSGLRTVPQFTRNLEDLATLSGWSRQGSLVWTSLETIEMQLGSRPASASLYRRVQASRRRTVLDVLISDDTAVDFMALVTCSRPSHHRGYTVQVSDGKGPSVGNVVFLTGEQDRRTEHAGNPLVGDTGCGSLLPLMCFRDDGLPAPVGLDWANGGLVRQSSLGEKWAGGTFRATEPVRGRDFVSIGDADKFCADHFGTRWRVADYHLAGQGLTLVGRGLAPPVGTRVWIDIKDQPYATCWARGSAAP